MLMIFILVLLCRVVQSTESDTLKDILEQIFDADTRNFTVQKQFIGSILSFDHTSRSLHFHCQELFTTLAKDNAKAVWPPLHDPPVELRNGYTMNGAIALQSSYSKEPDSQTETKTWSAEYVQGFIDGQNTCGGYNLPLCDVAIKKYATSHIVGKVGMEFCSQTPWAEGALLAAGAAHVRTVEYTPIISQHPKLSAITPKQLGRDHMVNYHTHFVDVIFSYSSFEHDGLGRYGDPMSPSADLESIARAYCLLKEGGILFLGLPIGPDVVAWNAHRIYGKYRMSVILGNWDVIDLIGSRWNITDMKHFNDYNNQAMWVLQKKRGSHRKRHPIAAAALLSTT
jgi:hypothetical protein